MADEPGSDTLLARLAAHVRQLRVFLEELWKLATTKVVKKALGWATGFSLAASALLWKCFAFFTCHLSTAPIWACWTEFAVLVAVAALLLIGGFICIRRQAALKLAFCFMGATVSAVAAGLIFFNIPPEPKFVHIVAPAPGAITPASPVALIADLVNEPNSPGGEPYQSQLTAVRKGQAMAQTHVTYVLEATTPNRLPKQLRALPGRNLAIAAYVFKRPSGDGASWSEGDARLGFDQPSSQLSIPAMNDCDLQYALVIFVFPLDFPSSENIPTDLSQIVSTQ